MTFEFTPKDRPALVAIVLAFAAAACLLLAPASAEAQSLRGSSNSLDRQVAQASAHDFSYLVDADDVSRFAAAGLLVRVRDGADYELKDVSFPYARPEVKLFIERLSSQFRAACGERLVVTSLTRPRRLQPRNASQRSVHPTGMALDIRRHNTPACRNWLDRVLLSLERSDVLEVTLERRPPHYHIALFPDPYARYVARLAEGGGESSSFTDQVAYTVTRKDTLWRIARRHGTTPEAIQSANGLRSTLIHPGQVLNVPVENSTH
jgi:nucleoid-associated protein YgaU